MSQAQNTAVDLSTEICGVVLKNPLIPASGTFGFGHEMASWFKLDELGAICLKGTTQDARYGNALPRVAECAAGMLNAIGLQNPGVQAVVEQELPKLREVYQGPVLANISGFSLEEYVYVAKCFDADSNTQLLEINVSCPNVHGGGMAFGTSAKAAAEVTQAVKKAVKKPVLIKLSPNVTNIVEIAKACEEAGADGLVLINTLLGLRLDPRNGKAIVSTGSCGFSGPAIKPVALRMVHEVRRATSLPIIGVGGIACAEDVLEFLWAGACAVQVGAQNLVEPRACYDIIKALPLLLQAYGIESIQTITKRSQHV